MYISLSLLLNVILGSLGIAALILFIILILKVLKLVNNISDDNRIDLGHSNYSPTNANIIYFIEDICESIEPFVKSSNLPTISKNAIDITDNVKGITDVATEATAEAIVAKDNFLSNYETIKDIINIIASIFIK